MENVSSVVAGIAAACCALTQHVADTITLRPAEDAVVVSYGFAQPRTSVVFETPQSAAAIVRAPSGVRVSARSLDWDEPSISLAAEVAPDSSRVDATWPVLGRVGDGWLIFLPSLVAEPRTVDVRVDLPAGWTLRRGPGRNPDFGFIYMGPATYQTAENLLIAPEVDPDIADALRTLATPLLADMERRFGVVTPFVPLIVVSNLPRGAVGQFVGDVSPNGVINLQISESVDRVRLTDEVLLTFLAHEFFHLWNAPVEGDGQASWWLTEGSAEYVSLLVARDLGIIEDRAFDDRLVRNANACLAGLDGGGLRAAVGETSRLTRYTCGSVVQWFADLQAGTGPGSVQYYTAWSALLSQASYSDTDFLERFSVASNELTPAIDAVLSGDRLEPRTLSAALRRAGVPVTIQDPTDDRITLSALAAFHTGICEDVGGVGGTGDPSNRRWSLHVSGDCHGLGDQPEIVSVEGLPSDRFGPSLLAAVTSACVSRRAVTVTLANGSSSRDVEAACPRAPAPPLPLLALEIIPAEPA